MIKQLPHNAQNYAIRALRALKIYPRHTVKFAFYQNIAHIVAGNAEVLEWWKDCTPQKLTEYTPLYDNLLAFYEEERAMFRKIGFELVAGKSVHSEFFKERQIPFSYIAKSKEIIAMDFHLACGVFAHVADKIHSFIPLPNSLTFSPDSLPD